MFIFLRNTARYDIMALILIDVFAVHCVLKTKKTNYFLNVLLLPGVELFLLSSGCMYNCGQC